MGNADGAGVTTEMTRQFGRIPPTDSAEEAKIQNGSYVNLSVRHHEGFPGVRIRLPDATLSADATNGPLDRESRARFKVARVSSGAWTGIAGAILPECGQPVED